MVTDINEPAGVNNYNQTEIGHYILEQKLGGGDYSSTFRGINKFTQETAAVKIFPKTSSISIELYQSEIKALSALRGVPGILQHKEDSDNNEYYFIVTEYIPEGSLRDILQNYPDGMHIEDVLQVFTPIAEAIDHIHEKNIVHRDLKPENILIRKMPA